MTAIAAPPQRWIVRRLPHLVSLAVLSGMAIAYLYWDIAAWRLDDVDVYWDAAVRVREGGALYGEEGVAPTRAYRYAPWFAYAWIPLTYVPRIVVDVAWSLVLLACSWLCIRPIFRGRTRAERLLVIMMLPILVAISAGGNVQAALLAALLHRLPKSDGPVWVAIAASLKVVPILLTLYLLAERRWTAAVVALALTAVLWLPILAFPVSVTTVDSGFAGALIRVHPLLYGIVAAAAVGVAMWCAIRRSAYVTLAAAAATVIALPRLFVYDVTWVLVGVVTPSRPRERENGAE